MVAPALMVAAQNIAGAPQDWLELPPTSAALLVEFGAETGRRARQARRRRRGDPPRARADQAARLHPRPRADRGLLDGPRGAARADRPLPRPGHLADHRGRLRAPGADRRVGPRHPGPARASTASYPGWPATPRPGTSTSCSPRTSRSRRTSTATRPSWRSWSTLILDKYDGSLKAEHGTGVNMAPYVEREWGEKATELMWRVKGLADPDGVLAPGVLLNRDEGAHLRNLKTTPEIEEVATTCVECGFCEPVCPSRHLTTTPAAADRHPPRDGPPAEGIPGAAGPDRAVRVRRDPDLRRRRHLPDRLPARDRHGQADQGIPRRGAHREGAAAGSPGRRALVVGREDGSRGASCRHRGGPADARRRRCRPVAVQRRARPLMAAQHAAARPGEAASDLARGRGRRLHARLRQPDLRAIAPRVATAARPRTRGLPLLEAMVAVSARAGMPVWIPDDVAGNCCSVPWASKGYTEGREADGGPHHRGALALER